MTTYNNGEEANARIPLTPMNKPGKNQSPKSEPEISLFPHSIGKIRRATSTAGSLPSHNRLTNATATAVSATAFTMTESRSGSEAGFRDVCNDESICRQTFSVEAPHRDRRQLSHQRTPLRHLGRAA